MDFLNPDDLARPGPVRIRAQSPDPYAGLKGIDYIKARGLTPRPNRSKLDTCQHCAQLELLPAVLNILASYAPRPIRQPTAPAIANIVTLRLIRRLTGRTA